jgi:acetyl esterase/lipase
MDIYVPGIPGHYPVVIWAHGSNQDKSTGITPGRVLAREGFVVFSIDWQDGSESRDVDNVPRLLREVTANGECAMSYAAEQAEQYGGDPQRVIWAGFSAGAYLGSLLAFTEQDYESAWEAFAADHDGQPVPQVECSADAEPAPITAYVANSGGFPEVLWFESAEDQELPEELLALRQVAAIGNNMDLRVRLIHGSFDVTTPLEDAKRFFNALVAAGYDAAFFSEQGAHQPFLLQVVSQIVLLVQG